MRYCPFDQRNRSICWQRWLQKGKNRFSAAAAFRELTGLRQMGQVWGLIIARPAQLLPSPEPELFPSDFDSPPPDELLLSASAAFL